MNGLAKATLSAQAQGGKIIAYGHIPNETFLYAAIVEFADRYEKYVVWNYNSEMDGFYDGYYTDNESMAYIKFTSRITK